MVSRENVSDVLFDITTNVAVPVGTVAGIQLAGVSCVLVGVAVVGLHRSVLPCDAARGTAALQRPSHNRDRELRKKERVSKEPRDRTRSRIRLRRTIVHALQHR